MQPNKNKTKKYILYGMLCVVLTIVLVIGITSLMQWLINNSRAETNERLKDAGAFGNHQLLRIEKYANVSGNVEGNFFLGCGSVKGTIGADFKLQFYWAPKPNEILATSLPYSKFRFIIDKTKIVPEIEFIFDQRWNMNFEYIKEWEQNLNLLIENKLILARVYISKETLEKEVYLPEM